MSNTKKKIQQQFQRAHQLITNRQYDEARKLLQQIDDPKAKEWLAQLEDKQKVSTPSTLVSSKMLLFGVGAAVLIMGLVLAFLYAPTLIEAMQPNTVEQYLDDTVVSDEEILYANVASYCYKITGYGGELCLDWTDMVMADHRATAETCLNPYREVEILSDEDYLDIGDCFATASVPDPL